MTAIGDSGPRVMLFDHWLGGLHAMRPLAARLREQGADVRLVHLESWRSPHVRPRQMIDGLPCFDISLYGNSLRHAINRERPDCVVMLNTTYTEERLINRLCRPRRIRTVYLMHGILS